MSAVSANSVLRLRTTSDGGTFTIEIDADRTRARLRPETEPERPSVETTFQLAPIDGESVNLTPAASNDASHAARVPFRAHVLLDGDLTWVFIDGETFTIEVEPAARAKSRRSSTGSEGLAAPMPATVIKLLVEPGAEVHRGDLLLLLEAMKMELPVRAPRDGRVKALHCRPGDLVQPGTALVDLE